MFLIHFVAACISIGPGQMCTEMYMESGLTVHLDSALEDGSYRFDAQDADGDIATCSFELPATDEYIWCDDGTRVVLDGDQVGWVLVELVPEAVDIQLLLDDAELASGSFDAIEYVETEYNGEGCDYAYNGEITLEL